MDNNFASLNIEEGSNLELKSDKYYKYIKQLAASDDNSVIITDYIAKETGKEIGDVLEVEVNNKEVALKIIGKYDGKLFNNGRMIIAKQDTVKKEFLLEVIDNYKNICDFAEIIPVSAFHGTNVDELVKNIYKYLTYGPYYFDEDAVTDQPQRQIVAELIREKALRNMDKEIPHGIAVVIDSMKYRDGAFKDSYKYELPGIYDIDATIICEKDSHKGIIIGKGGEMLKKIGSLSRPDMEKMLGAKVNLHLFVKVKSNWRDSDYLIKNFGYRKEEES